MHIADKKELEEDQFIPRSGDGTKTPYTPCQSCNRDNVDAKLRSAIKLPSIIYCDM